MFAARRKLIVAASALGLGLSVASQAIGAPAHPAAKQRSGGTECRSRQARRARPARQALEQVARGGSSPGPTRPGGGVHSVDGGPRRRLSDARVGRRLERHPEGIASCESGGDPTAVSADGAYRGKYQFDYGTWASVGGAGDPPPRPRPSRTIAPRCSMPAAARAPGRTADLSAAAPNPLSRGVVGCRCLASGREPVRARARRSPDAGGAGALERGAMAGVAELGPRRLGGRNRAARCRLDDLVRGPARPDADLHSRASRRPPAPPSVLRILFRNSLVLALHAFACVAGFIAGSSLAAGRRAAHRRLALDPREGEAGRVRLGDRRDLLLARDPGLRARLERRHARLPARDPDRGADADRAAPRAP